jgi:hypothetical protein
MNSHDDFVASNDSERDEIRAHFLRLGKLPDMANGEVVWVDFVNGWCQARIVRKIPGGCYIAKLSKPFMGVNKVTVMVKVFGGKVSS